VGLSTPAGRTAAVEKIGSLTDHTVDAVIACAGISAPTPLTVAIDYFGVVHLLQGLLPALSRSAAPRAAVVSSMASLQRNSPEIVDACLADDEARALQVAAELAERGPADG
jgi:hypothetical protein